MLDRLATSVPRLRLSAPLAISTAVVLTAATGASALTWHLGQHAPTHHRSVSGPAAARLSLPSPPAPASAAPIPVHRSSVVPAATTTVPRPHRLVEATVLVTAPRTLSPRTLHGLRHLSGVRAIQPVAAGRASVDGHRARVLGVNPARFRPWTPKLTAHSQPLWQSIARGELTASFDMGHQAKLPLGATVPVRAAHRAAVRVGAFASVGMAGVDAVVSKSQAARVGLRPRTGVILSAPHTDVLALRRAALGVAGSRAHASLLREVVVVRDAGEFLTRAQISTALKTAAHQVGKPYVWGATGPNSFDCSGLVQFSFAAAGIRMPRVSQQQWFAGPHISYANARPGDLLFWHYDPTDPTDIDHVAIYAGNGMMLVAPHTGLDVQYVPVAMNSAFAGVVRVDPAMAGQVG